MSDECERGKNIKKWSKTLRNHQTNADPDPSIGAMAAVLMLLLLLVVASLVHVHGWASVTPGRRARTCLFSTPERPESARAQGIQPIVQAGTRAGLAAGLLGAFGGFSKAAVAAGSGDISKVVLPPLPYAYDALAPHISAKTLMYHHDKHHAKYVETTVKMIQGTDLEKADLVAIMKQAHVTKPALFNNAAQAWNHAFYWACMKPNGGGKPTGQLAALIDKQFGSYDKFRENFAAAGNTVFGSGWAWLVQTKAGGLEVVKTGGAENPILDGKTPLLTMGTSPLVNPVHDPSHVPISTTHHFFTPVMCRRVGARLLPGPPEPTRRVRRRLRGQPHQLGLRREQLGEEGVRGRGTTT